jgi:hypothetical protein
MVTATSLTVAAVPGPPGPPTLGGGSVRLLVDNDYALFAGNVNNPTQLLHQNSVGWQDQVTSAASVALDTEGDYLYLVAMGEESRTTSEERLTTST